MLSQLKFNRVPEKIPGESSGEGSGKGREALVQSQIRVQ